MKNSKTIAVYLTWLLMMGVIYSLFHQQLKSMFLVSGPRIPMWPEIIGGWVIATLLYAVFNRLLYNCRNIFVGLIGVVGSLILVSVVIFFLSSTHPVTISRILPNKQVQYIIAYLIITTPFIVLNFGLITLINSYELSGRMKKNCASNGNRHVIIKPENRQDQAENNSGRIL